LSVVDAPVAVEPRLEVFNFREDHRFVFRGLTAHKLEDVKGKNAAMTDPKILAIGATTCSSRASSH
jgi:hypothetical protein